MSHSSPMPPAPQAPATGGASLEVRAGAGSGLVHEVPASGFLIGSVAGCDLRLSGANLPPVLALLTPNTNGVLIRRLAPMAAILVQGKPATNVVLKDGDVVAIAGSEFLVRFAAAVSPRPATTIPQPARIPHVPQPPTASNSDLETERRHLAEQRAQLQIRYEQRRDRLAALQESVQVAARKVQEEKRVLDDARRQAEQLLDAADKERLALSDRERALGVQESELTRKQLEVGRESAQVRELESSLVKEREELRKAQTALAADQAQHQSDLVRLHRLQESLAQVEKLHEGRTREWEDRVRTLAERENQVEAARRNLESRQSEIEGREQRLAARETEVRSREAELESKRAGLDGKQEEFRLWEKEIIERRALLEARERQAQERSVAAARLQRELDEEGKRQQEEGRRQAEERTLLEEGITRLRRVEAQLAEEERLAKERLTDLNARADNLAERESLLHAQAEELSAERERLAGQATSLQERDQALRKAEQSRAQLQEQLRRRSEELAGRQQALATQTRTLEESRQLLELRLAEVGQARQRIEEDRAEMVAQVERQATETKAEGEKLAQAVAGFSRHMDQLRKVARIFAGRRKALSQAEQDLAKRAAEIDRSAEAVRFGQESARKEIAAIRADLPELEARAVGAVESLEQAREQLRDHLAELHAYSRQSHEALDVQEAQIQAEVQQLRQQDAALRRSKEAHRLAVAGFRQQLIAWQGQVAEMRRSFSQDQSRLLRREEAVSEQARQIDATSAMLDQEAGLLQKREQRVAETRQEMERHLEEMRDWYRKKLRELSEQRRDEEAPALVRVESDSGAMAPALAAEADQAPNQRPALELQDPVDSQLGELLRHHGLVDAATLQTLLLDAHKQRRGLRQLLLAGGYLTLYQMALIEAGNLDALILGPLHVVDRIQVTARESVFRVFDPRRGKEAILRHLSQDEMDSATHPDEFRQRFAQALAVQHPNVAATLELMELQGRPAALQECVDGLPSTDWPALAAVAGVWYRLLNQALLALQTAHLAGLSHGHLRADHILLTAGGLLKVRGFGEPLWLTADPLASAQTDEFRADIQALGKIAATWASIRSARGPKAKPLPDSLQEILNRLNAAEEPLGFANCQDALTALEQASLGIPSNGEAWNRLVAHVREHLEPTEPLRQSA